jgi:hypothetical protein
MASINEIPHQWIRNDSSQLEANDEMNTSPPKHLYTNISGRFPTS